MNQYPRTLVIGANGKTGRRVADRLEALGWPVRRGSRSGTPRFDWDDPQSWAAALDGIEQAYVTFQPDLAAPGAPEVIEALSRLAVDRGVRKLVLLSGRGEEGAQICEGIVQRSGAQWTIVRASWFAQNFSEGHFLEPIKSGVFALPVGSVGEPFIDVDDVADVVVAALTDDRHDGELYEVTGPRLLSFEQAIATIGQASGRDIQFVSVSAEAYLQAMLAGGAPPELAGFFTELVGTVLDGRNAHVSDGVERALGRPARDFADYARDVAQSGLWKAA